MDVDNDSASGGFGTQHQQQQAAPSVNNTAAASSSDGKKLAHITTKRFADLQISSDSKRALSQVFKYEYMTTVQAETLPIILANGGNRDCLAKAKTG